MVTYIHAYGTNLLFCQVEQLSVEGKEKDEEAVLLGQGADLDCKDEVG